MMHSDTPGRLDEIARIRMSGVDLDREEGAVLVMGKGRRERWMPIGATSKATRRPGSCILGEPGQLTDFAGPFIAAGVELWLS